MFFCSLKYEFEYLLQKHNYHTRSPNYTTKWNTSDTQTIPRIHCITLVCKALVDSNIVLTNNFSWIDFHKIVEGLKPGLKPNPSLFQYIANQYLLMNSLSINLVSLTSKFVLMKTVFKVVAMDACHLLLRRPWQY